MTSMPVCCLARTKRVGLKKKKKQMKNGKITMENRVFTVGAISKLYAPLITLVYYTATLYCRI